jgi:hypothetical protein
MGLCRRDRHTASRNSAGSIRHSALAGRAPRTFGYRSATGRLAAVCGAASSGTNVAVKIHGRERYVTDSKTAAKPSSGFTIHVVSRYTAVKRFRPLFWGECYKITCCLHWPRTRLAVLDYAL